MTTEIDEYRQLQNIINEILAERACAFLRDHCPKRGGWERTEQGLARRDEHLMIRETISVEPAEGDFGVRCSHSTALGDSGALALSESQARSWVEGVLAAVV